MGWPQYSMLALLLIAIGIACGKDGEPKTGRHSIWTTLFAAGLEFWILWEGGFFK